MSGTPIPPLPLDPDGQDDTSADDEVLDAGEIGPDPADDGVDDRPLDPDLDDTAIDSAAADEQAAREGTLPGDA